MKFLILILLFSLNAFAGNFLIVHSKHDKVSREFVEQYGSEYKVIDFYDQSSDATKDFLKLGISISDFPSVVDTEMKIVSIKPSTMVDGLTEIKVKEQYKVNKRMKMMDFGKQIIATVITSGVDRGLSEGQRNAMEAAMAEILAKLNLGKLEEAKAMISEVTADGTVVTEALKTRVMLDIDQYLLIE